MFVDASGPPPTVAYAASPSKTQIIHYDHSEVLTAGDLGEKWVTLSEDGQQLEMAHIAPSIQEVKISAPDNKMNSLIADTSYIKGSKSKIAHTSKIVIGNSSKGVSGGNNFRGFKTSSPMKSNRVIHLSNIIPDDSDERPFVRSPRKVSFKSNPHISSVEAVSAAISVPPLEGKRGSLSASLALPPSKRAAASSKFPTSIRTNVVAANRTPHLKIPTKSSTGVSRTTLSSTLGPAKTRGKYIEQEPPLVEDDSDDEDDEYGVLSEDDDEPDDFDNTYFNG